MELKELKIKIAKSSNTEWFNKVITKISLPYLNYEREFTGVASIYEFLKKGVTFWDGMGEGLPGDFQLSRQYFETVLNQIENILGGYIDHSPDQLNTYWQSWIQGNLNSYGNYPVPFDTSEAIFLSEVFKNYGGNHAAGAYSIIARGNFINSGNKDQVIGSHLGLQFASGEKIKAFSFLNGEKKNLEQLTTEWEKLILEGSNSVSEYIKGADIKFAEYTKSIDDLKIEKKTEFEKWFNDAEANKSNLEKAYKEHMKLKEPAEYWKNQSKELSKEGVMFMRILIGLILFNLITLFLLIWYMPEEIIKIFTGGDYKAIIKWSIIYITFISFSAYGVRIIARSMLSAFHLSRDASERHRLTYFYLALSGETTIEKEERQLIIQSLFSRSDSGLLNTDTSPQLPSSVVENIFKVMK